MKKSNVLIEILKLIGLVILGWLLWIIIFGITIAQENTETIQELFPGSAFIFGVLTAIFIIFGMKFNQVHRIHQNIKGKYSNIQIVTERGDRLLKKANRTAEKYMTHEYDTLLEVTSERTGFRQSEKKIQDSIQFQQEIESYPELKANENVLKLLEQITDCETAVANYKISYNDEVASYNAIIHSFPVVLFRKIARFEEIKFYQSLSKEEPHEITDEMLGI